MDTGDFTENCTDTAISSPVERKHSAIKQLSEFAALCSFIQHFGTELGICLTFEQLVQFLGLEDGANWKKWESLHIKLLNLIRLRARPDRWEPVLVRFVQLNIRPNDSLSEVSTLLQSNSNPQADASSEGSAPPHVPRLAYYSLDFRARTRLLLALLEAQFERNQSFKDKVNLRAAQDLRIHPLGWDVWGRAYWLLKDSAVNILLYRDSGLEQETIQLLCETTTEIRQLYDTLKDVCMDGSKLSTILATLHPPPQVPHACNGSQQSIDEGESTMIAEPPVPPTEDDLVAKSDPSPRTSPMKTLESDDAPRVGVKPEDQTTETASIDAKPEPIAEPPSTPAPADPPQSPVLRPATCDREADQVASAEQSAGQLDQTQDSFSTPSGVRRSGRQRKPVEFLTMEPLHSNRSRSKPTPRAAKDEAKPKKSRKKVPGSTTEVACEAKKVKKDAAKMAKAKKSRKKRRKRRRHSKAALGARWDKASSSSETDDEEDETFERALLAHAYGDTRSSCSSSSISDRKDSATDWLDRPESDLDLDGAMESTGSEANSMTQGRNLARQIRLQKGLHTDQHETADVYDLSECCQICDQSHSPEWLLLCDRCDLGHHAMCLTPPRYIIPEGDWYCPRCQHAALLTSLVECADSLDAERKKHDVWRRMQERLNYVNISMTNILADGEDAEDEKRAAAAEEEEEEQIARSHGRRKRAAVRYAESNSDTEMSSEFDEEDQSSYTDSDSASRTKRFRRAAPTRYMNGFRKRRPVRDSDHDVKEEEEHESGSDTVSGSWHCAPRATRQKPAVYNINEAFKQLDEALETDEKYQEKKRSRHCRQATSSEDVPPGRSRGKDLSNILGPDWKEFDDDKPRSRRRRRVGKLSSSSENESADGTVKVGRGGGSDNDDDDMDFQPSGTSSVEQSGDSEAEFDPSLSSESASSDHSWLCTARRASRNKRRNTSNSRRRFNAPSGGRRRRPIPRFEQSSEEEEEDSRCISKQSRRPQRQTRTVVCYRESDEDDDANLTSGSKALSKFSKVQSRLRSSDDEDSGQSDQAASPSISKSRPRRRLLSSGSEESKGEAVDPSAPTHDVPKVKVKKVEEEEEEEEEEKEAKEEEEKEKEESEPTQEVPSAHDSSGSVSDEDEKPHRLKIVESPAEVASPTLPVLKAIPSPQLPSGAPVSPPKEPQYAELTPAVTSVAFRSSGSPDLFD